MPAAHPPELSGSAGVRRGRAHLQSIQHPVKEVHSHRGLETISLADPDSTTSPFSPQLDDGGSSPSTGPILHRAPGAPATDREKENQQRPTPYLEGGTRWKELGGNHPWQTQLPGMLLRVRFPTGPLTLNGNGPLRHELLIGVREIHHCK